MSKYFIFIPNFLSIIRICLVYPILINIHNDQYLTSLLYFILASITDALDGFLARRMSWQTDLGKILDPVADKLLLSGSVFVIWLNDLIPFYVFFVLLARDVIILLGASIHMSVVESGTPLPNLLGKITTVFQVLYIILILIINSSTISINLNFLGFVIVVFTLFSFIIYAKNWFSNLKNYNNE